KTYWYVPNANAVMEDMAYLKALGDKTVVFFEDIFTGLDDASYLATNCPNVKLIGSIRTSTLELRHDQIRSVVKRELREVDLNRLSEPEIRQFLRILSDYGLLGPLVEKTYKGRETFVREKCDGEIGTSLLYILKSDAIFAKLRELYSVGFQN